jgi:hypothetical protein
VGISAVEAPAESPRFKVVLRIEECDKENHGWREGPPLTLAWKRFDLLAGPSPSRHKSDSNEKRILLYAAHRDPLLNIGR